MVQFVFWLLSFDFVRYFLSGFIVPFCVVFWFSLEAEEDNNDSE